MKSKESSDTGLRGTVRGALYVNREVFYKRPEVQRTIKAFKKSEAYPKPTLQEK